MAPAADRSTAGRRRGRPGRVRAETSPAGQRLVVAGELDGVRYEQTLTVWAGLSRVDCTTRLRPTGADRLLRLRWPTDVPGGLPVSEVGAAVVGRGYGIVDVDSAEHPWTLDNPAYSWFGVGSTARVVAGGTATAMGVAEVVADAGRSPACGSWSSRWSGPGSPRPRRWTPATAYGALRVDSNLPDTRIAVGGPDRNAFTAAVLATAPADAAELDRQLAATGRARVWVPAERPLAEVWEPSADLRGERALPVLVLAGRDDAALAAAVAELVADLADATVRTVGPSHPEDGGRGLADVSVAMLSRGLPGFAVDRTGALHLSLARSCTGWPSGGLDRQAAPHGPGRVGVPAAALDAHVRVRARVRGRATGGRPGSSPPGRASPPRRWRWSEPRTPAGCRRRTRCSRSSPPGAAVVTAVKPVGDAAGLGHDAEAAGRGARRPAVRGARPAGHRAAAAGRRRGRGRAGRPAGPADRAARGRPRRRGRGAAGAVRGGHRPAPPGRPPRPGTSRWCRSRPGSCRPATGWRTPARRRPATCR